MGYAVEGEKNKGRAYIFLFQNIIFARFKKNIILFPYESSLYFSRPLGYLERISQAFADNALL